MNNIEKNLAELNQLVLTGRSHEAFEKYYDDDVIMQENEDAPTIGKHANRLREAEFANNLKEFRSVAVMQTAVNNNISFVVWKYDFTHATWGVRNYTQVSMQQWKDDKIIREQFFYKQ